VSIDLARCRQAATHVALIDQQNAVVDGRRAHLPLGRPLQPRGVERQKIMVISDEHAGLPHRFKQVSGVCRAREAKLASVDGRVP
jgi:hypothetical protein